MDCHYYFLVDVSAKPASASSRARSLWRYIDKNGHITVYKTGSATGLTMGQLVGVEYTSPPGWYERDEEETILSASTTDLFERDSDNGHAEDNGNEEDGENGGETVEWGDEWLGKIKLESRAKKFSMPGDSGALVFAFTKGTIISLGVHLGSPTAWPRHSVCLSLETFCLEGKEGGLWSVEIR